MNDVQTIMTKVLVALVPAAAVHVWLFGPGLLVNCAFATTAALAAEAAMLKLRGKPLAPALYDLSAPVTAVLLAFALPPLVPWWIPVVGTLFAIVVAKQLYGGIGFNPFNPAMAGYVVLLISFPVEMTRWPRPFDGVTTATPLDRATHARNRYRTPTIANLSATETGSTRSASGSAVIRRPPPTSRPFRGSVGRPGAAGARHPDHPPAHR